MRKNARTIWLVLAAIAFLTPLQMRGQRICDNTIFYHSFQSPLGSEQNPTFFPTNSRWYVALPKVGLDLALPMSYNDFGLTYDPSRDMTVFNVNNFIDKLNSGKCSFRVNSDVNVLGFGVKLAEYATLHVSSGVRLATCLNVPTGLLSFIEQGNAGENKHFEFGSDHILSAQAYGYISLGGSWRLPELPISLGARVNVLDGIQSVTVDNLTLDLITEDDISAVQMRADYLAHTAGLLNIGCDDSNRYSINPSLKMPNNIGVSYDVGARAKLGIFDLSVSLLDLGRGMFWKDSPMTIKPKTQTTTITFDGIDLTPMMDGGPVDTSFMSRFMDSINSLIDYTTAEKNFWSTTPTKLYAGVSATLMNMLRVGYLLHGEWEKGGIKTTFRCNNTLSAHVNLMDWLEVSVANSFTYDGASFDAFNPGVSVIISAASRIQMYLAAEYISNLYLTELKAAHVMVGLNIVGKSKTKR